MLILFSLYLGLKNVFFILYFSVTILEKIMLLIKWKVIPMGENFCKNEFSGMTCTHKTFVLQSFIFENERKICFFQQFFSWIPPTFIFYENIIQQMTSRKQIFNEKIWFHIKHKNSQTFLVADLHNFIHEYQCLQLIFLLKFEWKCEHSSLKSFRSVD